MSLEVPLTLKELRDLVEDAAAPTLTASNTRLRQAINYGYGKAVRAIRSVRPHHFASFVDNFSFTANQSELDISSYFPQIWRLVKLVVPSSPAVNSGSSRVVLFQYQDFRSPDYEDYETSALGIFSRVLYDIVEGALPATATTIAAQGTDYDQIVVTDASSFSVGTQIKIPGAGTTRTMDADDTETDYDIPTDYLGTVTEVSGTTLSLSPQMGAIPASGTVVTALRRRVLLIAPVFTQTQTGRLWYMYAPPKLMKATDVVDPISAEHQDMIVAYALAWLFRIHGDSDADKWFMDAQEMRSEMMQDIDPQSAQQTEAVGSALAGIGDW